LHSKCLPELFSLLHVLSLSRNLLHVVATQRYPSVLLLCDRWFSIRDLSFDTSDRTYYWCCVIHRLSLSDSSSVSYSLCIPTSHKNGRLQVQDLASLRGYIVQEYIIWTGTSSTLWIGWRT
jgi:hypothetical protein